MKRSLTSLTLMLLAIAGLQAAPLTPDEALARLNGNSLAPLPTRSTGSPILKKTLKSFNGSPSLYLFDYKDAPGYMVVSADDCVAPLLGYSDTGSFDVDNLPPALESWLEQYQRQIEYAREQGLTSTSGMVTRASLPNWSPIQPLLKTEWNQTAPYNNLTPMQNGKNCSTGCVATSMAQVMKYFNYPAKGQGSITYRCENLAATLSMDFSTATFDWNNMLNNYLGNATDAQKTAVATLMKACGYSVQMNYSAGTSGAVSNVISGALVKYFNYDPSVIYVSRSMKTYTEWATLIYNNLKNVGPVIYDGNSATEGGHSFVCDGYSKDGYFHFNWGWGGSSDGYFILDALDPPALGVGGGGGGFNFDQDVVLNIMPNKGGAVGQNKIVLSGSVSGRSTSSYMYIDIYGNDLPGFIYYGQNQMTFKVGCIITEADNPSAAPIYKNTANSYNKWMPLTPQYIVLCNGKGNYPFPMFTLGTLGIKDNVKYKVTIAYQPDGSNEWLPMESGLASYNYFYLTKSGSNYTFENFPQLQFTCTDLKFDSELYDGIGTNAQIGLKNNTDTQLTRGVTIQLLDAAGAVNYVSDSFVVTLDPGQTYSTTMTTPLLRQVSGRLTKAVQLYPALYDIDTDTYYYKSSTPVTMNVNPGSPTYTLSLELPGAQYDSAEKEYVVPNSANFNVVTKVDVTKGIYSKNMALYVLSISGEDAFQTYFAVESSYALPLKIVNAGQSAEITTLVQYPAAIVGDTYYLAIVEDGSSSLVDSTVTAFRALNNSGVESIEIGEGDILFLYDRSGATLKVIGGEGGINAVDAYYLNGMKAPVRVESTGNGMDVDLSDAGKGVVVVTAVDRNGNRKSTKIAL